MEPTPQPAVSIVIPTHSDQRWDALVRTLASARSQTYAPAEIVVVVDHNPALFRRARRDLAGVTVLENLYAQGVSGNRNTGAFHTSTSLIAFLDDDTVACPRWLESLVEPLAADPTVIGTGGGIAPAWEGTEPSWMPEEFLWAVGGSYAPAEIVVVVDHNPALFRRARRDLAGVTVLENLYAQGVSGNRNTGAFHTSTSLIAFLDDDTIACPRWLESLVEPLAADPTVIGTGGGIAPAWEGTEPSWMPAEFLWAVGGSYAGMPTTTAPIRNVWSASMVVRRDTFLAVGGFRTGFGKLGAQNRPEDTELCLRMSALAGGRWMYVPDAVIRHEVPASRSTFGFFLRRCYAEGRGKVAMAGLLDGTQSLGSERTYLRSLPRAVVRNLVAATRGRGAHHALKAGGVLAGVAAAGVGGVVETVAARRAVTAGATR